MNRRSCIKIAHIATFAVNLSCNISLVPSCDLLKHNNIHRFYLLRSSTHWKPLLYYFCHSTIFFESFKTEVARSLAFSRTHRPPTESIVRMCHYYAHLFTCTHTHYALAKFCSKGNLKQTPCDKRSVWQTIRIGEVCDDCALWQGCDGAVQDMKNDQEKKVKPLRTKRGRRS